jgi:TPR repeat protein
VAVVQTRADEKPKVLGIGGAVNLGGRNYDQSVYDLLVRQCGLEGQHLEPRDMVTIRRAARSLKEKLAAALHDGRQWVESTVTLHSLRAQKQLRLDVKDFESCCGSLIERFAEPIWEAMNRADVAPEHIDISILAGGSARMHYVRETLDALFPNDVVFQSLNPGEVVAKGLAVYGLSLTGELSPASSTQASGNPGLASHQIPVQEKAGPHPTGRSAYRKGTKGTKSGGFWNALSGKGKMAAVGGVLSVLVLSVVFLMGGKEDVPQTTVSAVTSSSTVAAPQPVVKTNPMTAGANPATMDELKKMSLEEIRKRAEAGETEAQYWLGEKYFKGDGIPQSDTRAAEWCRKAADQGNADAQFDLGWLYEEGRGVPQSDTKAVEWYRKAAEQGNANAQFNLGWMYEEGRGVSKSDSHAVEWYRKSAEQGNAIAQYILGGMYRKGRGVSKSDSQAVEWYRKAADQGDADAQNMLGRMYSEGWGITQSDNQAVVWFRKAAEQGHASGQFNLGYMYKNGEGVNQSNTEAVEWFRKAAEQGDVSAQYLLGSMYREGRGVPQSYYDAAEWYRKAADQGDADAQNMLGRMYQEGWGVAQSDSDAVHWFRKAAEQGNAWGQFNLAYMYKKGLGLPQSDSQAVDWFRKAAEQGNASAQNWLAHMYKNGKGVAQNYLEAYRWFYIAARMGKENARDNMKPLTEDGWFTGPKVSDADLYRIERDAEAYIRSKGWE